MEINTYNPSNVGYPERLKTIHSPPKQLFCYGVPPAELLENPSVAIVGSRNVSAYGKQVTYALARELAEQGVVIISGLAYGVDAIAHSAALDAGGLTLAVLPAPLDQIYPRAHHSLARRILEHGGTLLSEYSEVGPTFKSNFVARNRIVAGLANAVLITEAALKSGSLHTARFTLDQGGTVLAVPGSIYQPNSVGAHNLLKQGATVVTCVEDVLQAINIQPHRTKITHMRGDTPNEQAILDLLLTGMIDGDELLEATSLQASAFNQALTMLEIGAKIRPLGANQWAIR